jgi:hypothetical protein
VDVNEHCEPRRPIPREQNCGAVHAATDAVAAARRAAAAYRERGAGAEAERMRQAAAVFEAAARDGAEHLGVSWNGRGA